MFDFTKAITLYELISVIVAAGSVAASVIAYRFSKKANVLSENANIIAQQSNIASKEANDIAKEANRIVGEIAQRNGAIDLPEAWKDMKHVLTQRNEIITPNPVRAGNALHATATA